MGSVKDLEVLKTPTDDQLGMWRFTFSDRYSVFDWGQMPDDIPEKGKAITILAAYFFEKLEAAGIPTHYLGLVEDGTCKKLNELTDPVNMLEIKLLNVVKPDTKDGSYDYSKYDSLKGGFLIPLEVIYRNRLPAGSSVFKRLEKGELSPSDLGLNQMPEAGQKLEIPFVDVSTKLKVTDRYISWGQAKVIAGLSDDEANELIRLTRVINTMISAEFAKIGLTNEDGKFEYGFGLQRQINVVDVLGTLDECRFTFEGMPVSKEIARIYYRDTEWHQAVNAAKSENRLEWKKICKASPQPLPQGLKLALSQVYCACTNKITNREWFKDIPPLADILQQVRVEYGKK
jgi:phosphoribosylaminoimidazole-succinocarboxamide synthase